MADYSFGGFTPASNSRNNYFAELNKMQGQVNAPQAWGAPQAMPNFGDGGVAVQQAKNQGLIGGLQQMALRGAGNDINGWPLAAGPNPNPWAAGNQFAGAHERSRAVADAQRAQWAATPQRASIFAGLRGEAPAVANPFLQYHLSHWQPPQHAVSQMPTVARRPQRMFKGPDGKMIIESYGPDQPVMNRSPFSASPFDASGRYTGYNLGMPVNNERLQGYSGGEAPPPSGATFNSPGQMPEFQGPMQIAPWVTDLLQTYIPGQEKARDFSW